MAKREGKERTERVGRKRVGPSREIRRTFSAKFATNLERLINASGMTVREFSEKIGKSDQAVWKYLRGSRAPHINDWPKIAKVLGLASIKDLVPDSD